MRRLDGGSKTDFDPSNYIWSPRTDIFANGDGQFIYPGPDGTPIGTARLANIRDAIEDEVLLRMAQKAFGNTRVGNGSGNTTAPFDINAQIGKLVRSATDHTDDPALLESTRRAIADALSKVAA
jgi:hypothetical protein